MGQKDPAGAAPLLRLLLLQRRSELESADFTTTSCGCDFLLIAVMTIYYDQDQTPSISAELTPCT
jgi:hypothetical protein